MPSHSVMNRRDLDFLLHEFLQLGHLLKRPRFADHQSDDIAAMLDVMQSLSEKEIAPYLRISDTVEPSFDATRQVVVQPDVARAAKSIAEMGLFGAPFDKQVGGYQLPHLVYFAALGLLMSGSVAISSFMLLTVANARVIAKFGTPDQINTFARPEIAGQMFGTMCLSEPQAGSSLGDIRTRAVPDGEDGLGQRYRISGNKMWISAGDHEITPNIVHLVLAKVPDATGKLTEGTKGISLFIVPKFLPDGQRNDVVVAGLNHKLGYRGIPNCALNFGEGHATPDGRDGAVGWLVGSVGDGLPQMFHMMNEARIGVGLAGAALAYRGYLQSLDYARTRTQGRAVGTRGNTPIAISNHADVKRMLLAQKSYAEGALALVLYSARLLDDSMTASSDGERQEAAELLALLTPLTKSWPSEWAQRSLDMAIQIHGGYGYTRDFDVELLYRDNRLNPIHEGTTGIQAIDLVARKLRRDQGKALAILRRKVDAAISAALAHPVIADDVAALQRAWAVLIDGIEKILLEEDDSTAQMHATPLLFAMGHAVMGWLWLVQATHCADALRTAEDNAERNYRQGKLHACRYFSEFELPKIAAWLAPITSGAEVTEQIAEGAWLGEDS